MDFKYIQQIATDLSVNIKHVTNVHQLNAEGSTVPFISRYRKEATGNMDEIQVADVIEKIKYYDELEKRKETVIKTIETAGKITPELKQRIENTINATELEDIYLPYKPKRKTKASVAIEKGLEPLATVLFKQEGVQPDEEAAKLINASMEKTIQSKVVTYDFARLMEGATKVKCSEFADELIKNM